MSNNQEKKQPAVKKTAQAQKNNKEQLNMEEAFNRSEAFVIKYKKTIIVAIAVIVLIIVGIMLYNSYVAKPKIKEAAEALYPAENYFQMQDYENALNGDSIGNEGFISIADEYSGTPSGNLAKAYAGLCLAQLKRYEEAIPYLKGFSGSDAMVAPAVLGALGNCYAQIGDLDKAVKEFLAAAGKADNNAISPNYLLQAGIIYEQQGKKAEALKVYTEIKDKYFNSFQALDIDKYIERVK